MTDNANMYTGNHTASVTAYRADGWKVFFSFVLDADDPVGSANTQIAALAANGYTPNAPGVPEGGSVEMIGWVSRRVQINNDGRPDTPIIDLFLDNEGWNGRMVGIYLNTPEEVAAFEHACGVKLSALPLYDSAVPAKRDDARSSKYVVRLPHPAAAYIGDNPRWEGAEDKKNQKRKFFGWKDAPVTAKSNNVDALLPEVSEVTVYLTPKPRLEFTTGIGVITSASREPLKPFVDDVLYERLKTGGKHELPGKFRLHYEAQPNGVRVLTTLEKVS